MTIKNIKSNWQCWSLNQIMVWSFLNYICLIHSLPSSRKESEEWNPRCFPRLYRVILHGRFGLHHIANWGVFKTLVLDYWLLITGDYTHNLWGYHNPLWEVLWTNQYNGMREGFWTLSICKPTNLTWRIASYECVYICIYTYN